MFEVVVPFVTERLEKHHEIYSGVCKAEYWEENLCRALKESGFGSDWKPDGNHKPGVDQTTDCGIRISNKSGTVKKDKLEISGSRLTKHKTFQDKLDFLSVSKEDYIFCLATEKNDWKKGKKIYYLIVIDSKKLNYHQQNWEEVFGSKKSNKDEMVGWECISEDFSAKITKSMSDQLWTTIKLSACEEIYEIIIR